MNTPIQNLQLAQSLFAGVPAAVQRAGDQRTQLALLALRRQRDLADQATKFEQQKALTSLQTDRYLQVEDERSRRAEETQDRLTARQLAAAARRAYSEYAALAADTGETPKPFTTFGRDPEEAVGSIQQEMARLSAKQNDAAVEGLINTFNRRNSALATLRAQVAPSPEEVAGATGRVLGEILWTDTTEAVRRRAIDALTTGNEQIGLRLLGPQDRAWFLGKRAELLTGLQALRSKELGPRIAQEERSLANLESILAQAGTRNPKHLAALSRLGQPTDDTEAPATPRRVGINDFLEASGGKPAPAGADAVGPSVAAPSLFDDVEETYNRGGLLGLGLQYGTIPIRTAFGVGDDIRPVREAAAYVPGTLARMVGGEKLASLMGTDNIDSKRIQREHALATLRAATARRLQSIPGASGVESAYRSVLRSLFPPRPKSEPAQ